ncbi:hypothetical protein EST38_g192 [Candolleomyces aberdarensis]|uniref:Uncharacterized protein n=1 Tax=Candolleomyces aberdarensis TaxID=2316362 RepID=A0A4Q2E189_9AGAR|nr:hypothetical protein EST38_g192 [Candolleomyces aberdarensis]
MASDYIAEPGAGPYIPWQSRSNETTLLEGDEEVEGPFGGHNAGTEAANARLRWSLIISQQETKLWREQAEKTRTEYISFKSNAEGVQIELEYTQGRLDQAQSRLKQHEELVEELRAEIEHKEKSRKEEAEALLRKYTRCKLDSGNSQKKLEFAQRELERIKGVYKKQGDDLRTEVAKLSFDRDFSIAKQLDKELNLPNLKLGIPKNTADTVGDLDFSTAKIQFVDVLNEELRTVREELLLLKEQLWDTQEKLPEVQRRKLSVRALLATQAGTSSFADVVQKVNALNEEISEAAAFLSKVLVREFMEPDAEEIAKEATYEEASYVLNSDVLANALAAESVNQSLRRAEDNINPLLVQIVMQIALTTWCHHFGCKWTSRRRTESDSNGKAREANKSSAWDLWSQDDNDRFITELYETICSHENQAVAGHWRSVAKAHLPFSTNDWEDSLMSSIFSVMKAAGWAIPPGEYVDHLPKRLALIIKLLIELRKAMEATISQLRRDLRESELREKVYQEEAEETRLRLAKSMAEARILKRELESNRDSGPREVKEAARCWHCTRPTSGPASKRELKEVELSTPLLPGLASELEGELKDMQQELREARQRLRDAEQTLGDAVNWADSMREKEIEGSNMFLDQGRMRLPEADVVQTVKAVNESIFEMARHLAGIIVYDPLHLEGAKKEEFFGRTEFTAAYQRASILGEDLADGLVYKWIHRREREGINPWLVRTVMQFALTHWCVDIWSMDWQRAAREFNGEVASQDSEDQHTVFSNPIDGIARQKDHHSFIADLYETICIHGTPDLPLIILTCYSVSSSDREP